MAVLVLDARGYEAVVNGTNGFTCIVERSWTKAFDDDNFWNPRVRTPVCYNPQASRTVLPYTIFETKMALAGATEAAIRTSLTAAIADKQLSVPETGSMAYMMSKDQYIDDHVKAWYSHVMVYTPRALGANSGESWGADRVGSPVVYDSGHLLWPQRVGAAGGNWAPFGLTPDDADDQREDDHEQPASRTQAAPPGDPGHQSMVRRAGGRVQPARPGAGETQGKTNRSTALAKPSSSLEVVTRRAAA